VTRIKVGDLVKHKHGTIIGCGIVLSVDDTHRQATLNIMFGSGIVGPIWINHIKAI